MSTTFSRVFVSKKDDHETSYLPACSPGIIPLNVAFTMLALRPRTVMTAVAMSASAPSTVLLSEARYSIGA